MAQSALQADGVAIAAPIRRRHHTRMAVFGGEASSPLALDTAVGGGPAALTVRPASKQTAAGAHRDMLRHQAPRCVRYLQAGPTP